MSKHYTHDLFCLFGSRCILLCYSDDAMPKDDFHAIRKQESSNEDTEEVHSLLSQSSGEPPHSIGHARPHPPHLSNTNRRQSSLSHSPANGGPRTPRTANRVRFHIEERSDSEHEVNGHVRGPNSEDRAGGWLGEEDCIPQDTVAGNRSHAGQRAPLLTDIEAPSVTVASTEWSFNLDNLLENARPKSGMSSAFMNMANSIM